MELKDLFFWAFPTHHLAQLESIMELKDYKFSVLTYNINGLESIMELKVRIVAIYFVKCGLCS